ncbi:MAG: 23S rRNA (uracil(1939)-C(5))-methyltransferase RlmD [Ruminococcaceae bacterium]|nr:23S rRNA (uracil(1939)-C(5))-methyltransferase RlmD [Oscillospiraceae bacterium]
MTFTKKIEEMNLLGNGITKLDGCVVFCLGAIDGDTVTAEITREKKNFKIANVLSVDEPSPHRQEPDCPHFPACGGCDLRHISYSHELEVKKAGVEAALRKAGKGEIKVSEILSAEPDFYRNKAVLRFDNGICGFSEAGSDNIVSCDGCRIIPELFCEIGRFTVEFFGGDISDLSYLFLRKNSTETEISAVVGTREKYSYLDIEGYSEALCEKYPQVVGVLTKSGDHPEDGTEPELIFGQDYIEEDFLGLSLIVSPCSFFQVNHAVAEKLCKKAAEYALSGEGSFGADLYCGTGVIGMAIAALHPEAFITGVEINESAVADAKENAEENGLTNIGFFRGDSADFAKSTYGSIDFITIDPPRAGCSEKMIKELLRIKPQRLVYVSCDPQTLARDLKKLTETKYEIKDVCAADLFPRTKHVETIVLLERK